MTKVRAHPGSKEQGAGRSSPWSLPGETQPRRVSQAVRLGVHRPSFRLLDWSRGSGEGDAQALWSTIRCVLRGGDLPPPPNILSPDNLPTRTLDCLSAGPAPGSEVYRGKWCGSWSLTVLRALSRGKLMNWLARKNNQKPCTVADVKPPMRCHCM